MTQSKRLIAKRGNIRFERIIDSKGKVLGYRVSGQPYDSYAEARHQFRSLIDHPPNAPIKFDEYRTIAPSPDDTSPSSSGSS